MTPRLLDHYRTNIIPALSKKFGYKNAMQAPRIHKIVLNMGIGAGSQDIKFVEQGVADMMAVAGQKPVITRAKKAIANFKIRQGLPIGCKVTLRGNRMYEFLDRFLNMALPRIRDFRGTSPDSFDENGNYSIGIKELSIFPEIDVDKIQKIQGMDIIMNIKSSSKEESYELLKLFGMPFTNKEK